MQRRVKKKKTQLCPTFQRRGVSDSQSPRLVQNRRLNSIKIILSQLVVNIIEEGELIEDLRDPAVSSVLSFSDLVNFLLKFLQS